MTKNTSPASTNGPGNPALAPFGTTIFATMSAMAAEYDAINMGQGMPDDVGPEDMREVAAKAVIEGPHHYPPMMGMPELRQAVAAHHESFYDQAVDWESQVMITSGGTEGLAAAILGLLGPGDEAVVIAPYYDAYIPLIRLAGATPIVVSLKAPDWDMPGGELDAAFERRPKALILNSPMNPTGKVFTQGELSRIATLAQAYETYVICDEVYEHLVYPPAVHMPMITYPAMAERTIRIGSAGKSFFFTGWKVGYMVGAPALIDAAAKAHQFLTFTTPPSLQTAVAYGFGKSDSYFQEKAHDLEARRDRLAAGLAGIGLTPGRCDGTYFITADIRQTGWEKGDLAFCEAMTKEAGVTAIPMSVFFPDGGPDHMVRFSFAKDPATLDEAVARVGRFIAAG